MKKILTVASVFFCIFSANAEDSRNSTTYVDFGYSALTYSDSINFSPTAARIIIGQHAGRYLGYEGMLGLGANSNTQTYSGTSFTVSVPSMYGFYIKAYSDIRNDIEIYGRLGYTRWYRSIAYSSTTTTASGTALSYGAGMKYAFTKDTRIFADYMMYQNGNGSDAGLTGYTFGVGFDF